MPAIWKEVCKFAKNRAMSFYKQVKRVTTHVLHEMKLRGEKIAMLTAYDYSFAGSLIRLKLMRYWWVIRHPM